jgi:hypothetical protein
MSETWFTSHSTDAVPFKIIYFSKTRCFVNIKGAFGIVCRYRKVVMRTQKSLKLGGPD